MRQHFSVWHAELVLVARLQCLRPLYKVLVAELGTGTGLGFDVFWQLPNYSVYCCLIYILLLWFFFFCVLSLFYTFCCITEQQRQTVKQQQTTAKRS